MLHLLGDKQDFWSGCCQVSDALKVFEKRYTFVEEIGLTEAGVLFASKTTGGTDVRSKSASTCGQNQAPTFLTLDRQRP